MRRRALPASRAKSCSSTSATASRSHTARAVAVVFPESRDEVQRIVRACREHGVPFVPRGAGTGLSGGALADDGAVVIECSRMNRILELDPENRFAVVQPGVVNADLSRGRAAARPLLRARSVEPAGVHARRQRRRELGRAAHAEVRHHHPPRARARARAARRRGAVELGAPTGFAPGLRLRRRVRRAARARSASSRAITVRLVPMPEAVETLLAIFPDVVSACRAVGGDHRVGPRAGRARDRRPAHDPRGRGERLRRGAAARRGRGAARRARRPGGGAAARRSSACASCAASAGAHARARSRATTPSASASGARARARSARWAGSRPTSTCTTRSCRARKLPESCSRGSARSATATGCTLSNVFHAGDGNLHPNISFDRRDPDELARVLRRGRGDPARPASRRAA